MFVDGMANITHTGANHKGSHEYAAERRARRTGWLKLSWWRWTQQAA